jgi:haloalkane dehalogenase
MELAEYDRLPSKRIAVDGGEMFAIDAGRGPTVVLVHGSPVSSLEFRAIIARLRPTFRAVAPDLLSFGQSTGPPQGADFMLQAQALRGFLDALDLDRFHLVVHDWGGPIGLAAAARRPGQVGRLVFLNTSIRPALRPPPYWRAMTAAGLGELALVRANLFSHGLPLFLRAARRDHRLRRRYAEPLKNVATRRTILKLERLQGYASECERIQRALPEIDGPKMILWGRPDPYFLGESKRLRALFPTARTVELRGAGHFAAEDAAGRVSEAIFDHLR